MITILFLLFFLPLQIYSNPDMQANHVLYLMQSGNLLQALECYKDYTRTLGHHDTEILQQIGLNLLEQGYRSNDPESQLLTLFGAGISMNEKALYILEEGMKSAIPQLQLVALNFLSHYQNDQADIALQQALGSNYLLIRLEGAYILSQKKSPRAVPQTEALMAKVDQELLTLFPQLFAMNGTAEAIKILKRLLVHASENVRIASILSAAKYGRDDLLPIIRKLATHHHFAQQEACAWALGELKDESSIPKLQELAKSKNSYTQLAALLSLGKFNLQSAIQEIQRLAEQGNVFAIFALGELPHTEELLAKLLEHKNPHIKINAAFALLEKKDPRALLPLSDILLQDSRDFACIKVPSPGGSQYAYKIIPSARENIKNPMEQELALSIREEILERAAELPEKYLIPLAHTLFMLKQNDLIPTLVEILETRKSAATVALLKKHQQQAGAPLIRNYCNLALFRLKEEGFYTTTLKQWIAKQQQENFIFRPFVPWKMRDPADSYQLTPEETSRLLIESFEALISAQEDSGIDILLQAIQEGNPKNKYALAGLLMRASQ